MLNITKKIKGNISTNFQRENILKHLYLIRNFNNNKKKTSTNVETINYASLQGAVVGQLGVVSKIIFAQNPKLTTELARGF